MSKEMQVVRVKMRQEFSPEERQRIVTEFDLSELGHNQFAKSVGIAPSTLSSWLEQHKSSPRHTESEEINKNSPNPSLDRLQKLEAENQALETENEELRGQIFQIHAFMGRKMFELEMRK